MKIIIKYTLALVASLILYSTSVFAWPTPVLDAPANAAFTFAGVTLDWSSVIGSDEYELQLDTTNSFNSPVFFSITKSYINSNSNNTDTEHFADDLYFGTVYYWRVRAYVTGDTSTWAQQSFTTRDFVLPNTPASGMIVFAGVTLDWMAHTGVDFYDVEADSSLLFNSPLYKSASKAYINSNSNNTDTEHFLDDILFGETYYWRVRARNAVDTSQWSTPWSINTLDEVLKTAPASGSNTWTGLTQDWLAHPGVDFYDMEADTVLSYSSPGLINVQKNYINSNNSNTDTQHATGALVANTNYYWRVRAINAVDTSAWTVWTFSTSNCAQPDSIIGQNAICFGSMVTYSVLPVAGATSYNWTLPSGWSGTSSTESISVTAGNTGGNISVSVNNACGVSPAQTLSVTVDSLIGAISNLSGALNVCEGNLTSYIVPVVPGATSYVWSTPSGWNGTSNTNNLLVTPGATSGDVSVYAINACDSTAIVTITVTVTPLPAQPGVISGDTIVCNESINSFSVTPVPGATSYNWTLPSGWNGNSNNDFIIAGAGNMGGTISVSSVNGCGNSTPATLNVIVNSVDTTVMISGVTISANASNATYQWFDCDNNQIISGETNASYTPAANGNYSVIISQTGCVDTSSCIAITSVGITEINPELFQLYPNPSSGNFTINTYYKNCLLKITDLAGREIINKNLSEANKYIFKLPEGMYLVSLYSNESYHYSTLIITP